MRQPVKHTHGFRLGCRSYIRTGILGLLMFSGLLICAVIAIVLSTFLWKTYIHNFTLYLKWQDALVALLCFIAFLATGGCILVARFLYALHVGYTSNMITLTGNTSLTVRDLSPLNLATIFWLLSSTFWCFVAALVGLFPAILIGWTMQLSSPVLAVLLTGVAILLSVAGVVVSIIAITFIIIGCVGVVSFGRKLGGAQTYELSSHTVLRIDNFVLTIIYPGAQESMVDLSLLSQDDQRTLLSLLRERWVGPQRDWNPALGEEIEAALQEAELRSMVLV